MEALMAVAGQYGAAGLIFLALGWFIVWSQKQHREERSIDRKERGELAEKTAASTDKLSDAVTALQITLVENRNVESNR